MGFPECLYDITKVRQNVLLKQFNIIQVYKQIIIEKERTAEEVANRKEASEQLIQSNLEKDKARKMREEKQTREDGRNLIEGFRQKDIAKRDLEELERKKFLSSSQPQLQPQIESPEELAEAERIRAEAERKRLNDDILRQEKHERDVAKGLVSSGPKSFSGPSLDTPSGDSFNTAKYKKSNANAYALLKASINISIEDLDNFTLTVIDQIDKQIGIFIFWIAVVKPLFDSSGKQGAMQTVQTQTIQMYNKYRQSIKDISDNEREQFVTNPNAIDSNMFNDYKIRIACIIHEQQFTILDKAMNLTVNSSRFILNTNELTKIQQCIAILLCLTPDAFFISKVPSDYTYTNEMSQELNKELVQYEWSKKYNTGNLVYLYGATVRFDTYTDSERPWYISEQTKFIFGVKNCYRAIEDTGNFTNNPRGFANIKKLMEDLGLSKSMDSSYFFIDFPTSNDVGKMFTDLKGILNLTQGRDVIEFVDFFSLNKELILTEPVNVNSQETTHTSNKQILQLVKNEDQISDLIKSPIRKIKPQYMKALLVYIRDERSKCSYIGTYRLTGKKPKGGRKTRRQRRTKQRKHKVKGQKKTRKQRQKKTQKRRSKK